MFDMREVMPTLTPYQSSQEEDYMSDQQLEHFKQILQQWKNNLIAEVEQTVNHLQDELTNLADPNDRASQEEEFTVELRTRDRERKLIKKIDYALAAIDNGDYGYCVSCGAEIGLARLEARPTAAQCIDCKTRDEFREKYLAG
jgi:DnaK suppressor protein